MCQIKTIPTREQILRLRKACDACIEYNMAQLTLDHLENAIAPIIGKQVPHPELEVTGSVMKKYIVRLIEIEAVQFFDNKDCFNKLKADGIPVGYDYQNTPHCYINTLKGLQYLTDKAWIIKDVHGKFYSCGPIEFEAEYERSK